MTFSGLLEFHDLSRFPGRVGTLILYENTNLLGFCDFYRYFDYKFIFSHLKTPDTELQRNSPIYESFFLSRHYWISYF